MLAIGLRSRTGPGRRGALLAATVLATSCLLPVAVAEAQTVWGGTGSSTATSDYNLGSNWSNGTAPVGSGQSAAFNDTGSATVEVSTLIAPDKWIFGTDAQNYAVTGETLVLDTLTNNANAGQSISIANDITSRLLQQAAASTLTLSGATALSGNATITAGTLVVSGSLNSAVTLSGNGSFLLTGTGSVSKRVTINDATSVFDISGTTAGATVLAFSGSGTVKLGAQRLTLSGNLISAFSGAIQGTGGLTVQNGAILRFNAGTNTYTGSTIVDGGTITIYSRGAISASSVLDLRSGTIVGVQVVQDGLDIKSLKGVPGSYLELQQGDLKITDAWTDFAGTIRDSSTNRGVTLTGGHQTFSGTNTYTGTTTIDGGTLSVNGSIASSSLTTVNNGGTLGGTGTVGNTTVANGGTIAPGNSIGTLTVSGDITFATGSILAIEVTAPNQADRLSVSGTATIDGGSVTVGKLGPEGSYQAGQTYRILDAGTLVRNADFNFTNPFLYLTSDLQYGATSIDLVLAAGPQRFNAVADTSNQSQTATALADLEQSGDALAVYNELLGMTDTAEARRAFDLASGEVHASGEQLLQQTFGLFSGTFGRHAPAGANPSNDDAPLGYAPAAPSAPGVLAIDGMTRTAPVTSAWLTPMGAHGSNRATANSAEFDWWTGGLAGGYETRLDLGNGDAYAGFGIGYLRSQGAVDARLSSIEADSFYAGGYGGWTDGAWSLSGGVGYGASATATRRQIVFGGIDRTAEATYWSQSIGFSGEAAFALAVADGTTVSPLFTLDAGWTTTDGFTETGAGALNLTSAATSRAELDTGLGLETSHVMLTETGKLTLDGRLVWQHGFADAAAGQTMSLAGSPTTFEVEGAPSDPDRMEVGVGLSLEPQPGTTIRAGYTGRFSSTQQTHGASLGLNAAF